MKVKIGVNGKICMAVCRLNGEVVWAMYLVCSSRVAAISLANEIGMVVSRGRVDSFQLEMLLLMAGFQLTDDMPEMRLQFLKDRG